MTLTQLTAFFGWMTVINVVIFILGALFVLALRGILYGFYGRLFAVSEDKISSAVLAYMCAYELFIIFFNLAPWIALGNLQ